MLQAVRVFLMVRELSLTVRREPERQLPLSRVEYSVQENEVLDLSMLKIDSSILHARQSCSMARNCGAWGKLAPFPPTPSSFLSAALSSSINSQWIFIL